MGSVPTDPQDGQPLGTLPTCELLASALEGELLLNLRSQEVAAAIKFLIRRARSNYYHDFFGALATPEIDLVNTLRALKLNKLAQRVIDGEFDSSQEESDLWVKSKDYEEAMKSLFHKK